MDLVQTVRKEGTRGGRGEFKWDDVKNSSHRENYLGHSLMAPVGRWQKNKDLSWYAKGEGEDEKSEAEIRKEEIKRIKQAEEDAIARALGQDVPPRGEAGAGNPNLTELGEDDKMRKSIKDNEETRGAKGVGYGSTKTVESGRSKRRDDDDDDEDRRRRQRREHRDRDHRRHDRSRERDEKHRHRHRDDHHSDRRRRDDSRSLSRERRRSGTYERRHERDDRRRHYNDERERRRSRSPHDRYDRSRHRR